MSDVAPESSLDAAQEQSLFFGMTAARLRGRVRWAAIVFLVSLLVPYDIVGTTPIFAWEVIAELHPSAAFALLALPLAGAVLFVGSFLTKRGASLGFLVLGALLSAALIRKLGSDRAAWNLATLPDSISARPAGALFAIAATAAAANLKFRRVTRPAVPYVLGLGLASALYFYAWPQRGEAPLSTVLRALKTLPDLPDFRFQIGLLLIVFITLWPLFVSLAGLTLLRITPSKDESWLAMVANWSLTLWLGLLATRSLAMAQAGLGLLVYLQLVAVITAVIALLSAALAMVVESFFVEHGDEAPPSRSPGLLGEDEVALGTDPFAGTAGPRVRKSSSTSGLTPKQAAMVAVGVTALLSVVQVVLARPPQKGTDWELSKPDPKGDRVFDTALLKWARVRRNWDLATRKSAGGAEQRLELKAAGKDLVDAAKDVDPGLGKAFEELTAEADELDLEGRKWGRLVTGINEANRKAKLPYFVDPDVFIQEDKEGLRYHFFVYPYRIEEVHPYKADGQSFATLRVRQLGHNRETHFRLGFSRDEQPFALVVLDETDRQGFELQSLVNQGYCTNEVVSNRDLYKGLNRCGELLAKAGAGKVDALPRAVLAGTERHELQHQIDGPHLPLAGPVLSLLEGYAPSSQDRVNREASAFIAELTADGLAPKLGLLQLAQYLLMSESAGGIYAKTSIVVFEALSHKTIRRGLVVDGDKFWDVYEELFELSDEELQKRARSTWKELFDSELADPKD